MSVPATGSGEAVADRRDLVDYLAQGCKPAARWRIGTEHERFPFHTATLAPVAYDGDRGIGALLDGLRRFGWEPVTEAGVVIGLSSAGGAGISLEPGGQFELSGAPLTSVHETCAEIGRHHRETHAVAEALGIGFLAHGTQPQWLRESVPWMPKGRYRIMGAHMPRVGQLGLDMMLRTCTVQVNLDFASEADMVAKFRVGLALQPVATALFANSPFMDGQPNGYLSYRSAIWMDTDPQRTGILPFVFESGMGFERYVDYMLDVPMYFVYRGGRYIDAAGQSFRDFLKGRLPALPGVRPTMTDWANHLTTAFPEVRLKHYLEMRGADAGPAERLCALPAFWVGLLYNESALSAALDLIADWTPDDHARLRRDVPRFALKTPFKGRTVRELAREVLEIARAGLRRRAIAGASMHDESGFLDPLLAIADSGRTPAEDLLESYDGRWGGSVAPLFREQGA